MSMRTLNLTDAEYDVLCAALAYFEAEVEDQRGGKRKVETLDRMFGKVRAAAGR